MKTINKDLAMSYSDMMPSKMSSEHYPTVHLEGKESLDLPKEGTMTVKFKKVNESETTRDGETQYSCTLELHKLVSVEGGKLAPTKRHNNAAEALDKLMAAASKDDSDEGEY